MLGRVSLAARPLRAAARQVWSFRIRSRVGMGRAKPREGQALALLTLLTASVCWGLLFCDPVGPSGFNSSSAS